MGKLKFKSTPAEDAQRAYKKARKEAKRSSKHDPCKERQRRLRTQVDDFDAFTGRHSQESQPEAGPSRHAHMYDESEEEETRRAAQAEEDARFREKMMDALEDDGLTDPLQRLDGVEARMNDYVHIPRRWRGTEPGFAEAMMDAEEDIGLQPWQMNDDEYAEFIRAGMWRRQNAAELEARHEAKRQREAKARYSRTLREETARLEGEEQERKRRKKLEKKRKVQQGHWEAYEEKWAQLLRAEKHLADEEEQINRELAFMDVPWPVLIDDEPPRRVHVDDITTLTISAFLRIPIPLSTKAETSADRLSNFLSPAGAQSSVSSSTGSPNLKDALRATMLRFHPDKFETRVLKRVRESDRERVMEAASAVVRAISDLMKESKK